MMLDWHLTTLGLANLMVEHKMLGDKSFEKRYPIYSFRPEQFSKEVHKNLKMLSTEFKEKRYWGDLQNLTISDILIFNEILTLNLINHDISKYPGLIEFLNGLYNTVPTVKETLKPIHQDVTSKGISFYIQSQKL